MSRTRILIPILPVLLATVAPMVGCLEQAEPAGRSQRDERIALLEAQLLEYERLMPRWQSWYDALAEINERKHVGLDGLMFERRQERVLWDGERLRATDDPLPVDETPAGQRGALISIVHFARQLEQHGIDLLVVPVPPGPRFTPIWSASTPRSRPDSRCHCSTVRSVSCT